MLCLLVGLQVEFERFMQRAAERCKGRELVGSKLWQYRYDAPTIAAAGAVKGEGTWQEAQVVQYNDQTGEHEVSSTQPGLLVGSSFVVHLKPPRAPQATSQDTT